MFEAEELFKNKPVGYEMKPEKEIYIDGFNDGYNLAKKGNKTSYIKGMRHLAKPENIHRYKSNKRWNDSDWKYLKEQCFEYGRFRTDKAIKTLSNIMLDYRIIVSDWHKCRLSGSCLDFLYDMSVIAENLGFPLDLNIPGKYDDIDLSDWQNRDIYTRKGELFCNLKLYKNGNRHIKFCKEFMQKLNVEMARITGWIHDKTEAAEEFGISEAEVSKYWNNNLKIGISEGRNLLGLPEVIGA